MEAQPQLLLLQKTMLVAEGVGRRLCPDVNMWELAKPLIQQWMLERMAPETRIRDTANSMLDMFERMPFLIKEVEETLGRASKHGIQVDPTFAPSINGRAAAALDDRVLGDCGSNYSNSHYCTRITSLFFRNALKS